jgi:lysophospholipase L1-like esterase
MRLIVVILCAILSSCGASQSTEPAQVTQPPASIAATVVFTGDSITLLMPVTEYVPGAINAGVSGNETSQMLERFDADVLSHHPSVVVILGGINDIKNNDAFDAGNIFAMVQQAMSSGAQVIVGTVMAASYIPHPALENQLVVELNEQLRIGAEQYGYTLVDYHAALALADGGVDETMLKDGLHPNKEGYDAMWGVLKPVLAPLIH